MGVNHAEAPVLEALAAYQDADEPGFTPPGHKHARGADPRARAVLGDAVFYGDILANGGLDDRLPVVMDISDLGTTGYRAADWPRAHHHIDARLFDHRRVGAQLTHADDERTTARLLTALRDLAGHAAELRDAPQVTVPSPADLRMEQAALPRDAYLSRSATVPTHEAAGRIAAERITPYPPGTPVILPGERLTEPVLKYLLTGVEAGMFLPDAADRRLDTVRVVAER